MKPIARRRLILELEDLAELAGRLDMAGELGVVGLTMIRAAEQALKAGCYRVDVEEAVLDGLIRGRAGVERVSAPAASPELLLSL